MFDRRDDLVKFLAVAEAGKVIAAAEALGIAQPALTRAIARLERRCGGKLFERLPTGVRPTPLGTAAAELAMGVLREIEAAEENIGARLAGRTGRFRITATPVWMQAVLAPACEAYRKKLPGIELVLRTAPFAEGLRLLARGDSDLHCGGFDAGDPLPIFLRRDSFLDVTAGIVAGEGHPLLNRPPAPGDLAACPWIDFDRPVPVGGLSAAADGAGGGLDSVLEWLFRDTGRRAATVVRAGAAGLFLMATGPWLSWLPLELLDHLAPPRLRPLPIAIGRHRYRTGFIARRSAEELEPFRALQETVRETALERSWRSSSPGMR